MKNPIFIQVKEAVNQWLNRNKENFTKKNIKIEIIHNTEDVLRVTFNFGKCLAGIIVEEPGFAPYRFVCFELAAIENGIPTMPYWWYDEEGTTIEEIIVNLEKAIDIVFEYNNNQV